ncbi:MAG: IPT/TIG domain-containing protein [Acidimicrobiales bacterium]
MLALAVVGLLMAASLSSCSGGTAPRHRSSATSRAPTTSTSVTSRSTTTSSVPPSSTTTLPPTTTTTTAVPAMPVLAALSPLAGPAGTRVTMTGSDFGTTPGHVTFTPESGAPALSAEIVTWSEDAIVVVVPAGLPSGLARPDVWDSAGVEAGPAGTRSWPLFTVTAPGAPGISGLSPQSAPTGARFTIVGTNLGSASNGAVTFCEFCGTGAAINAAAPVISWSGTQIVGTVPALQCGTAEVWVRVGTWNDEAGAMNITNCGS